MSRRGFSLAVTAAAAIASGGATVAAQVPLTGPAALALDGDTAYVVDVDSRRILRLDLATRRLTGVTTSEPLRAPFDIDVARDRALVVQDAGRVVRISLPDGRVTELEGGAAGRTPAPAIADIGTQVAADPRGGAFVLRGTHVLHVGIDGTRRDVASVAPVPGRVADILADEAGHLFVATTDTYAAGQRILRIDATSRAVTTVVGPGTPVAGATGTPAPRVTNPDRLAWDRQGRLVFTDATRILRVEAGARRVDVVSERRPGIGGWAGLAVTADGDLIVTDYAANRIHRIGSRSGRMTTLASGRTTPLLRHGETIYAPPADEICSNEPGDAVLDVQVQDSQAAVIPGAVVRLFSPGLEASVDVTGRDVMVFSDAAGVARIRLPAAGEYVVLVNLAGFLPSAQAVRLSTGCTARLRVRLDASIR